MHKVLKRLKEKGKLKKPKPSSSNGHGPSKLGTSHTSSSTGPETPDGPGESIVEEAVEEEDMDMDMDVDMDDVFGKDDTETKPAQPGALSPTSQTTPRRTSMGGIGEGLAPVDTWSAPNAPKAAVVTSANGGAI